LIEPRSLVIDRQRLASDGARADDALARDLHRRDRGTGIVGLFIGPIILAVA
jgi:hypothetical protein